MTSQPTQLVAEEIRAELARRRISGAELARRLGRPQSSIARRLNGETAWDVNELAEIAQLMDLNVADLLAPGRR